MGIIAFHDAFWKELINLMKNQPQNKKPNSAQKFAQDVFNEMRKM